jgi:flavin-dependent dehydrogenase
LKEIVIVGGGLAGLTAAINLAKEGVPCKLIEKNAYPFHRVCGEYVSNEVLPFLKLVNLIPREFDKLPKIKRFQLSTCSGRATTLPLDLGGFGISRFALDHNFYLNAKALGVQFVLDTAVDKVSFLDEKFLITTKSQSLEADVVVGSYGKKSRLDVQLRRDFTFRSSPYVGVKYHVRTEFPDDMVALHNFSGGYCGVVRIENGLTNLCYLAHRSKLRSTGGIAELEGEIVQKNPLLGYIFRNSEFIFEKPIVINEISFETKPPVEEHILMSGDAAGMIAPLCGNGMAMAIQSGKLAAEAILKFCSNEFTRDQMENYYRKEWTKRFAMRLWFGRKLQGLFGSPGTSNLMMNAALYFKPLTSLLIKYSHGKPF